MNREILFRGKSLSTGQWLFGFYRAVFDNHEIIGFGGERWEVDPTTVGQFTGLLDKNGTKIFEGDIMSINPEFGESFASIIYEDGAFKYRYDTSPQKPDAYRFEYHNMSIHEVVGNIHDKEVPHG